MISFEFKKIRKSTIPIFIIFFNLVGSILGSLMFALNRKFLADGTQSLILWGQTVFYAAQLFTPILIGVICAISCQFEENNKNWQRLLTIPLKPSRILQSKILSLAAVMAVSQILVLIFYLVSALMLKVPLTHLADFISWSLTGWLGSITIIIIQLFISIRLKNFAVPILISAVLSLAGLMTLFVGKTLFTFFPYSQIVVGIRSRALVGFTGSEFFCFLLINAFYIIVFYLLALREVNKRFL